METIAFPTDILIEIFKNLKSKYSLFRCLSNSTRIVKMSWDGWDAVISQGYSVKITKYEIRWELNGNLHSFLDLPARELSHRTKKCWYRNGELHRDGDLPAIEWSHGSKHWYRDGKLHRDGDLPASEWSSGAKNWYRDGKPYKDNGLPVWNDIS